jgi:prolyl-tRNA synthetase
MRYTQFFINTQKEKSQNIEASSHDLALRANLVHQVAAGLYDFLPLGQRVINKIENTVREEMNTAGAMEISMPIIQPAELWAESGRLDIYGKEMFRLKNREEREFCLGPTHEELVCHLVRSYLRSYKQLPFNLYQIGRKFRDEKRPRHGLLRAREFLMKDAYSFDADDTGLEKSYELMRQAYLRLFYRVNLDVVSVSADPGEMRGSGSEEFLAPAEFGEDLFLVVDGKAKKVESKETDTDVHRGIEVGHIFKLGNTYSKSMNVKFTDSGGLERYALMGCYGLGISRLVSAIIEQHHDNRGIIWPRSVAPFEVVIIPVGKDSKVLQKSESIYDSMQKHGIDVLLDDRDVMVGTKFNDADLIGIPFKFILGPKSLSSNQAEYEYRSNKVKSYCRLDSVIEAYHWLI